MRAIHFPDQRFQRSHFFIIFKRVTAIRGILLSAAMELRAEENVGKVTKQPFAPRIRARGRIIPIRPLVKKMRRRIGC